MSKKKIIGGVCAALAVVVVGGYVITSQKGAAQMIVSTETLQQMDLKNTISLTGTVETQTGRKVYSTLTYPVESVNVEVGDVVQKGDVLAKLKTDDLELDIAQQQAAVTASNNQAAHQIEVSRKAYENAKENYENGLDSSAISAEQSVTQAENNVTQSEYSVESAKLQVESAEAAVRDARENYRLTRDQLEGNVTDAEKALDKAEEALSDAKAAYNDAVAGVEGQIAQAEANFAQIKADYDIQKATYDNIAGQLAENVKNAQTAEKEAEDKYNEYKKAWGESSPEAIDAKAKWDDAVEARVQAQQEQLREKEAFQAIEATYNQAQTDLATVKSSIYGQTTSAQSAVASAESGVASAEAQLDAAKDARNGTTLAQVEQGIVVWTVQRSRKMSQRLSWMQQNSLQSRQNSSRKQLRMQLSSRLTACRTAWLEASWQQKATVLRKLQSRKCRILWKMPALLLRFPVLLPQFMQRWESREMACSLW